MQGERGYAKKVGQLTMQIDWLQNVKKYVNLTVRASLVKNLLTIKEIFAFVGDMFLATYQSY